MMRFLTLMVTLSCLLGTRAETVSNYLESFENMSVNKGLKFAPPSWGRISDSYMDDYEDTYVVEYTNPSGGQKGSFLKVGEQQPLVYDDWEMGYVPYTLNDYLITPAVGGKVSFYLKKTGSLYSQPNVQIYLCTKQGKEFELGDLKKEITYTQITDSWTQFSIPDLPVGTYLAFRMDQVGIDEFFAETAEAGKNISMDFKTVQLMSKPKPVTTEDNKVEVTIDATINNIGEVDLTPGMKNYSLSIVREEGNQMVELVNVPVDQSVKIGQSSQPIRLTATFDAGTETQELKYSVRENLTQNVKFVAKIVTKPYRPEMILCEKQNDTPLDAATVIDFGFLKKDPVTKTFRIMNTGFAPLNITALTLPEGYTTTLNTPVEVAPNGQVDFPITLGVNKTGSFSGKLVIKGDNVANLEYDLLGVVLDKNGWYEDFESNRFPSNMVVGENWAITNFPGLLVTETNGYWAQNSNSSEPTMLITPKLKVKKGESFNLKGSKRNSNSKLKIYYSADRAEWQLAKSVSISEFSSEKMNAASADAYKFTPFTLENIPEGEWYIGIEGGYVRVDDLYGFSLVPVEHDFYFSSLQIPETGMVNFDVQASAYIRNLAAVEDADSYTVKLYMNGEVVAEAATSEFMAQQEKAFNVTFTPHKEGVFDIYFEIAVGDVVYKSKTQKITIKKEMIENKTVVGANGVMVNTVPLSPFYKNSASQTIYTADELGLTPGTMITKISYEGYCTSAQELIPDIAIYIENTKDSQVDASAPRDVNEMTLVYKGKYSFLKGGSRDKAEVMLSQEFNEPFEYTGQNLRIVLESTCDTYKYVYFTAEENKPGHTIYKASDHGLDATTWKVNSNMPIVTIYSEKTPKLLSGMVRSVSYGPLRGIKVKLISGNVLYESLTNGIGQYAINVVQDTKDYQAVIDEIPNYQPYYHEELINLSTGNKVVNFIVSPLSGVDEMGADGFAVYGTKGGIVVTTTTPQVISIYNIAGRLVNSVNVEEGRTTIEGLMAGFYIVNGTKVMVR